jgi:hypothetical protein
MRDPDADTTFRSLVEQYEKSGWVIRSMNQKALRATAQARTSLPAMHPGGVAVVASTAAPVCRKLWIDSQGEPQETNVPC